MLSPLQKFTGIPVQTYESELNVQQMSILTMGAGNAHSGPAASGGGTMSADAGSLAFLESIRGGHSNGPRFL
jgi:hypothetical protein